MKCFNAHKVYRETVVNYTRRQIVFCIENEKSGKFYAKSINRTLLQSALYEFLMNSIHCHSTFVSHFIVCYSSLEINVIGLINMYTHPVYVYDATVTIDCTFGENVNHECNILNCIERVIKLL